MNPGSPLQHTKHIFRVFLALVALLIVLVLGRTAFVPETYGLHGRYRGASVSEYRVLPVRHGGDAACASCHDDQLAAHAAGGHHGVRCELCHAPVASHIANDDKIADMTVRREAELCLLCHRALVGRPESFPQIEPRAHVVDHGGEFGPAACFDCHDPHAPL